MNTAHVSTCVHLLIALSNAVYMALYRALDKALLFMKVPYIVPINCLLIRQLANECSHNLNVALQVGQCRHKTLYLHGPTCKSNIHINDSN